MALINENKQLLLKEIKTEEDCIKNCDRLIELLQPEWELLQANELYNVYVARIIADHMSSRRKASARLRMLLALQQHIDA